MVINSTCCLGRPNTQWAPCLWVCTGWCQFQDFLFLKWPSWCSCLSIPQTYWCSSDCVFLRFSLDFLALQIFMKSTWKREGSFHVCSLFPISWNIMENTDFGKGKGNNCQEGWGHWGIQGLFGPLGSIPLPPVRAGHDSEKRAHFCMNSAISQEAIFSERQWDQALHSLHKYHH